MQTSNDLKSDEGMPDCLEWENRIDAYSAHYGIDPEIVEKKDVTYLYMFQALRNREAVINDRRKPKS